ncbi:MULTISPECIES: hypothetical protein [Pseudomonas syringae group]|uniref:hypothetical protein n=1 Tax=Pseudomonas syringae group TaxID=136849 RepID=UPI000E325E95|nr:MULTISPECIES: hypothetical protein [Pseudomonas syringae group]
MANTLAALSQACQSLMILVIENAQYLVTEKNSEVVLGALKAARDEINVSSQYGLRIAFLDEYLDALAALRSDQHQTFFCAPIVSLKQPCRELGVIQSPFAASWYRLRPQGYRDSCVLRPRRTFIVTISTLNT